MNAHNSQINCITGIQDKFFATGAMKEIKIWKFFECLTVIQNAHSNSVLCIKAFKIFNSSDRNLELILASGSKDKNLKFWGISSIL